MKLPAARITWLCAAFLLCYVGSEVALGGWIVQFMIKVRNGNEFASGMVSVGFWLGITLGRIVLGFITPRIGEKLAVSVSFACRYPGHLANRIQIYLPHRDGLGASLLAGSIILRLGHCSQFPGLLSGSNVSSHHCGNDQIAAEAFTRTCCRLRSRLWWVGWSDLPFCYRSTGTG
jgi:hypothetical protein